MPFTTLLLSCAPAIVPAPQALDRAFVAQVVEPYLERTGVPGAVVAFVVDGQPALIEPFGLADLEAERPMTADTRFQVGSVTKPVTATLVAQLVDDGVLGLDDELGTHLDGLPGPVAAIRVGQLLTHFSGLPRESLNRRNRPNSPTVMEPLSVEELLEGLARTELERAPGEAWSYSNLGYAVAGAVVARATGEDYHAVVAERLLAPLGMHDSLVPIGSESPARLASCYWDGEYEPIAREPWRFGTASAFCGLVSTAGDLARFLAAQLDDGPDAPLSPAARALLHTPVATIDEEVGRQIALGWIVSPLPGGLRAFGHGGEVDGHSAVVVFFPELDAGVVVLCNRGGDSAEGLARALTMQALERLSGR